MATPSLHVVMFPWFAMGHITPYHKLSNKLAERGHRVSFLIPTNTQTKFNNLNLYPQLIEFIPLTVPKISGLPPGAETTSDLGGEKTHLLLQALDLTQDQVESVLHKLRPDFVFYDLAYWIPSITNPLGVKAIYFGTSSVLSCIGLVPRLAKKREEWTEVDLMEPPEASSEMTPQYQMKDVISAITEFDGKISLIHRFVASMSGCDALCFNSCNEVEGKYVDYLEKQYQKQVLLIGPCLAEPSNTPLEAKWADWLGGFEEGSVVYCAFGSECVLEKGQFQELVLGLELTSLPFLVRLKPPVGAETLSDALPEGFQARVRGRGVFHEGWVQQQHILSHPSVGCFVSHCGFGSMMESLVSHCQLVLVPHMGDQFVNAKFMAKGLRLAVDIERREQDGWFTKEDVCKAVKLVMEGGEVGVELKANHHKWKDVLSADGLQSSYFDNFLSNLQRILQ